MSPESNGMSGCCKACGKPVLIEIGEVNDVVNASLAPECECGKGFNVWWPKLSGEIESTLRDAAITLRWGCHETTAARCDSAADTLRAGSRSGTQPPATPLKIAELTARAKNQWCAFPHGHSPTADQLAAIDELARLASSSGMPAETPEAKKGT